MNQKGLIRVILVVIIVALIGAGTYFVATKPVTTPTSLPIPTPAPTLSPSSTLTPVSNDGKIIRGIGEREGSFLIQKINPNSVEGLWYEAYPVARVEGEPKTLHIGDDIGYACEGVSVKLVSINFSNQTIAFSKVVGQPPYYGCSKCLAGNSLIDTPSGQVLVKDLQVGMSVWTTDINGQRVSGVIAKTSKVLVPATHQMVHFILDDGRDLLVSPAHPTIDGQTIGDLAPGDLYDGVSVAGIERVFYGENATYDILPSGDTGFYWANGILIGSTLNRK